MKKLLSRFLALLLLAAPAMEHASAAAPIKGVVRVKLQPELVQTVDKSMKKSPVKQLAHSPLGIQPLDASLRQIKGVEIRKVFPSSPARAKYHQEFGLDQWYEITFDPSINPLEAKRVMAETPGVVMASERKPMENIGKKSTFRQAPKGAALLAPAAETPFNDPFLPQQWHYHNDGSLSGSRAGADINLFEAWKINTGSRNVLVAVIDGGIDTSHEDLADAMWVNEAELNGLPGVDDDGNGYVDDVYGYNFCSHNATIYPQNHGTHVAGTIGAINNNGIGVAGVAGGDGSANSGVRLMSCQVFDPRPEMPDGDFAAALVYAADNGATLANCSWGWSEPGYYEQDVLDAVRYFTYTARSNNMTGGLCIFSAGNDGLEGYFYPAAMDEVVSVASICCDFTPAPYSNYGPWVDVCAPGGLLTYDSAQGVFSTLPNNNYGYNAGTSMATPHVTGIAALIMSQYGSPTLVNDNLRQQLITSVNDYYTEFPGAEGYFGSGYIDAYKAMQWGDGSAPNPVDDLEIQAAQDNVVLTWTIPASSGGTVDTHIIYYSESEFDSTSLSGCKTITVDTKFHNSGEKFSYQVDGLRPQTTYYFAVCAVDRWGEASELSEVISVTTNHGPEMTLSRAAMNITTTDGENWTSNSFEIGNVGSGLLRWSASMRTLSSSISAFGFGPVQMMTTPYSGNLDGQPVESSHRIIPHSVEDFVTEDYPQELTNCEQLYAYIGDPEPGMTNSMAQLFTVDSEAYPHGFNLSHVQIYGGYGQSPTIEIYSGGSELNRAALLETVEFKDYTAPYYVDLPLIESLHFGPGESFYIVVHFSEFTTRNYPLGLGLSNGSASASQAYISNDWGETWSLLSTTLKGTNYESMSDRATWAIVAKSLFPDWSQILTLSPSSGYLPGNSQSTRKVTVEHNGTKVPNGNYRARIIFDTNETAATAKSINVNINVSGNKPDVSYNKIVQFGNVLVGKSKTVSIDVTNYGYGAFAGGTTFAGIYQDNISSTSDQFRGPEYLPYGIPSRSTISMDLTFAPTSAGSHSGKVILKDCEGRELVINVQGAATEPPHIETEPDEIEIGDLDITGEPIELAFTLSNTGKYPLQYVMPKFSSEQYDEVSSAGAHKFGYTWQSNIYGGSDVQYSQPNMYNATCVNDQFGDYDYFSDPVNIGFEFPFYGKKYEQVYISSLGLLSFGEYTDGTIYSPVTETTTYYLMNLGVISAYGFQCLMAPDTRIEYAHVDGNLVVNFANVLVPVYGADYIKVSYHITLFPSGDIEVSYDNYDPQSVMQQGCNLWAGILDPMMSDPLTITSATNAFEAFYYGDTSEEFNRWRYIKSGTTIKFIAPRPDLIVAVSPTNGLIAPDESVEVKVKVAANDQMYAGPTFSYLAIQSNDIKTPTKLVKFNANIVGNLKGRIDLASSSIDFGRVFRTAKAQMPVTVQNHGRNVMTIESVTLENGLFSHNFTSPVEVAPGQSKDIIVTMPTDTEGERNDVMTIVSSVGTRKATLTGQVGGMPVAELSYDAIAETLPYGSALSKPLQITNTGNEPLLYSITAGEHIEYIPEFSDKATTTYTYRSSLDYPGEARDWYDIETSGLGTQYNYTYFMNHEYVAVDLPFTFYFYNKPYNRMYVYNSGFVSFTERRDNATWPEPPGSFPYSKDYTNVIAPYWGLHTMDITSTAGIYHYVTDDEAVVSYIEYGNSMNVGVDFQLILRKDGSFTFNYKPANLNAIIFAAFGLSGISNIDGEGIRLSDRYIELNTSTNFYPIIQNELAPGESSTADIKVVADNLAGSYQSAIRIATNEPNSEEIQIPVSLEITGQAMPSFPEDIVMEHVAEYVDGNYNDDLIAMYGAMWYAPINIRNTGAAAFTITDVEIESPQIQGTNLFSLYWHNGNSGWMPYRHDAIEVGTSQLRMAVPMIQSDNSVFAWATPGTYDIKLTFHLSNVPDMDTYVLNIKYIVSEQPNFGIDRNEIRVTQADDNDVITESFVISNEDGGHELTYALHVEPAPANNDTKRVRSIQPNDVGNSENVYDCPSDMDTEYIRALYWPALASSVQAYNYGSTTTYGTYKAATGFTGPAGGFNITHVYTAMYPYLLDNKDVKIEIVNGDVQDNDVLGSGTYHIGDHETAEYENIRVVVPLDHPVYISEGQLFYVVITYPAGQPYPATLIVKQDAVKSYRYMGYWDNFGWFDVGELFKDNYGSLGYLMTCLEASEGDAWIKLLDDDSKPVSDLNGTLQPGEKVEVKVRLNVADAPKESGNMASINITTNDPKCPSTALPVYLDKNGSPQITAPTSTLAVHEGESVNVNISVIEPEGEDMTISIADNGTMSRIVEAKAKRGNGSVTIAEDQLSVSVKDVNSAVDLVVTIEPEFGSAGAYTFTAYGKDSKGHENFANVNYTVMHVNRAPVAVDFDDLRIPVGNTSDPIDLAALFIDPDGDELSLSLSIADKSIAEPYMAKNSVIFAALAEGTTEVTVTATDSSGATANNVFKIHTMISGIADIAVLTDVTIYPNPVVETLYVETDVATDMLTYEIYSINGLLVIKEQEQPNGGRLVHSINVSALPTGYYVLKVSDADGNHASYIVIKN